MLARKQQQQWIYLAIINQLSKETVFLESKNLQTSQIQHFQLKNLSQYFNFRKNRDFFYKRKHFTKNVAPLIIECFFHLYFTDLRERDSINKAVYRTHLDPITDIKLITKWNYLPTKQFCLGWGRLWFWSHLQWFYISVIWFHRGLCCIKEDRTWLMFSEWS